MARTLAFHASILLVLGWNNAALTQSEPRLQAPELKKDGIETAAPQTVGVVDEPLYAMETAIRGGEFKKIGSVLVARHGKLVYEGYFDGDGSTLRDTRSATKSITDVLVGIAIGEKKLSGVDNTRTVVTARTGPEDAESRSPQRQDHRRRFPDYVIAARVRRLE
jgi:CubicO group peptidase (beta-lactamase class C family)